VPATSSSATDIQIWLSRSPDTIIMPAKWEGFEKEFLGNHCWFDIRIAGGKPDKIKYIWFKCAD
jgi:hypothetical protein